MEKDFVSCLVTIDIETIPEKDTFEYEKPPFYMVGEHGSLKDPEKIKEWKDKKYKELCDKAKEDAEKEWRAESLKSFVGRILCIAYQINEEPIKCVDLRMGEKELLQTLYNDLKPYRVVKFIGANLEEFDLLYIFHRALHYGLYDLANLLRNDKGYTKDRNYDVMFMASGGLCWKYKISLNNLCKLLGVKTSKDGIDGSKVLDFYLKGEIDKIVHYCKEDVRATKECFNILK